MISDKILSILINYYQYLLSNAHLSPEGGLLHLGVQVLLGELFGGGGGGGGLHALLAGGEDHLVAHAASRLLLGTDLGGCVINVQRFINFINLFNLDYYLLFTIDIINLWLCDERANILIKFINLFIIYFH